MSEISKRTSIRLISFATAAVTVLAVFSAVTWRERELYRRQLEYTYLRSIQDASDLVTNISVYLDKGIYASSSQLSEISASLWKDASAAKASLSSLPISELDLAGTYKFLSQVGDYSMALTRKSRQEPGLTKEETQTIRQLRDYASALSIQLAQVESRLGQGALSIDDIRQEALAAGQEEMQTTDENASGAPTSVSGFMEMEESFAGYPTLIYDGPFSDHILQSTPALTEGTEEISRENAALIAAQAAGCTPQELKEHADEESRMPCYNFGFGDIWISVTKNGGYLNYMLDSRSVGSASISNEAARASAMEYLSRIGLSSLKETYYETANNIMTINFAHVQDGVVCYTDLVKIGVALDDGSVVAFDARGYIMNHKARSLPEPKISVEAAEKAVSPLLTVQSHALALIPSSGKNERLCHEFTCRGEDGEQLLVYIDAATGEEAQILKLIITGDGVLTK